MKLNYLNCIKILSAMNFVLGSRVQEVSLLGLLYRTSPFLKVYHPERGSYVIPPQSEETVLSCSTQISNKCS